MKLPVTPEPLSLAEQVAEFDVWITPSLGEIRDTRRFRDELEKVVALFDALSAATNGFPTPNSCDTEVVTDALLRLVVGRPSGEAATVLHAAAATLFLSTGKSDNNAKCQLPLHLRDVARWPTFPVVKRLRGVPTVSSRAIPRVLRADDFMALVAALSGHEVEQRRLLAEFVRFVLSDDRYVAQLWSIGNSYVRLKAFKQERALLTPLVIFQVRGSVSASGGHDPERTLRERFAEWGLIPDVDFNLLDVRGGEPVADAKSRAYDFVLPYRTPSWAQRVFVQSQFYAGDSGSVSHKNVDQTKSSRDAVRAQFPDALFVEYVDGAGYFSSLKGDLKRLLSMPTTASFAQVRSTPIRLRRVLQQVGFLTPLEIEHAIARTDGTPARVKRILVADGYTSADIRRGLTAAVEQGTVLRGTDAFAVRPDRRAVVRRYLLLDVAAINGSRLDAAGGSSGGCVLVPGFGPLYGLKLSNVLAQAQLAAPSFAADLGESAVLLADVQWLQEKRFIVLA